MKMSVKLWFGLRTTMSELALMVFSILTSMVTKNIIRYLRKIIRRRVDAVKLLPRFEKHCVS